jgi:hypothetical protein
MPRKTICNLKWRLFLHAQKKKFLEFRCCWTALKKSASYFILVQSILISKDVVWFLRTGLSFESKRVFFSTAISPFLVSMGETSNSLWCFQNFSFFYNHVNNNIWGTRVHIGQEISRLKLLPPVTSHSYSMLRQLELSGSWTVICLQQQKVRNNMSPPCNC